MTGLRVSTMVAVSCTAVALVLDLQHWAVPDSRWPTSEWWRFIRTVAAVAPAVTLATAPATGPRLLAAALGLVVVADWCLILRSDLLLGIGLFGLVQVLLVFRHVHGAALRPYLEHPELRRVSLFAVVLFLSGVSLLRSPLAALGLAFPVAMYSVVLLAAVVTAYGARYTKTMSPAASRQAFLAMVLFAACDVTVGIGAAYGETSAGQFVRALTGVFYTPALLLLVRSGRGEGDRLHW